MQYVYNVDQNKAYWITNNHQLNVGHGIELSEAKATELEIPYKRTVLAAQTTIQPAIAQPTVIFNSLNENRRVVYNKAESFRTLVYIEDPSKIDKLTLNGKTALSESQNNSFVADLYGMAQDSLVIELQKKDSLSEISLKISTMFLGMPEHQEISDKALRTGDFTSFVQTIKM